MDNLEGRIIAVTGANSGLGKEISLQLAAAGARILMLCRNPERGDAARSHIISSSKNSDIDLLCCDLSSFENVRNCAAIIGRSYTHLDALINNAGIIQSRREETIDCHELTFQVNYLSHFLLTGLLIDKLRQSHGRVINISSIAHWLGRINFKDIDARKSYFSLAAYAQSKLANILFTYELAKRQAGMLDINCVDPGLVNTTVGTGQDGYVKAIMRLLAPTFAPVSESVGTIAYLTGSPEAKGLTGRYFQNLHEKKSSPPSYDPSTAERLWALSMEYTRL